MGRPSKDKSQRALLEVLTAPDDPAQSREDPWSQMPGEPATRYKWFLKYRDQGPGRSVARLAKEYGKARATMFHMCNNYRWVDRANAWDDWLDRQFVATLTQQRREAVEQHMDVSQSFIDKVCERLLTIDPQRLTPGQVSIWFDLAVKVQRVSLGLETLARDGSVVVNQTVNQATTTNTTNVSAEIQEKILGYADVFRRLEETQRSNPPIEHTGDGGTRLSLPRGEGSESE